RFSRDWSSDVCSSDLPARWLPGWRCDTEAELLQAASAAVAASGREPKVGSWAFCTNGSESAGRRGIPTIGLGPGNEEDAHTIDEIGSAWGRERVHGDD